MAWWKRKARCELCGAKLRTGSALSRYEQVYVAEGKTKVVRFVCEACWQRHLPIAAEVEVRFRRENPFEDVCARLRDGDAQVRATAARQLARLGDKRAVAALCDVFAKEGWKFPVAGEIVKALGVLGGSEAESALIAELHNEHVWHRESSDDQPMPSHADYIAWALLEMGGSRLLLRALFETMASKPLQPSIRAHAASYLSNIAYRSTVGYSVTGWVTDRHELTGADRELMVEPLRAALRDESPRVQKHAAAALGHLGKLR
ncbi:HEAT repeat domain-containing protein [Nonomuraea sp. 3N208]|uniref:HEAT repeat domain-containing protein n=1 Tax=Nonomuraea sp. 3N208 TaxID=3457421 RepID=UPI003FD2229F